jgi:hypothetical protein
MQTDKPISKVNSDPLILFDNSNDKLLKDEATSSIVKSFFYPDNSLTEL